MLPLVDPTIPCPTREAPTSTVAWISLVVSTFVLGWNVLSWRLNAGRVRVRFQAAAYDGIGLTVSPQLLGATTAEPTPATRQLGRYWELFQITVENTGRTAVTISSPVMDYYPTKRRPWGRFAKGPLPKRKTVAFPLVEFRGVRTDNRVRLEPFDTVTFLMHAEGVALRLRDGPEMWVRARVDVAGRPDGVLSSHRTAIALGGGRWGFLREKPSADMVAFRSIKGAEWHVASEAAVVVQKAFKEGAPESGREVTQAVAKALEIPFHSRPDRALSLAFAVRDALRKYEYLRAPWEEKARGELSPREGPSPPENWL